MEDMSRRKFLRDALTAATAVGVGGAIEAGTNKAEATALNEEEFEAFIFGDRLNKLFKLREEKGSSKHEVFEAYYAAELEKFLQAYALAAKQTRTKQLEVRALNDAISLVGSNGWNVQIIVRLSYEMKQRL